MSRFQGTDFLINLPDGCSDESTYAFTLPGQGPFRPSVVIKTERLPAPVELPVFAAQQMDRIKAMLPAVAIVHTTDGRHHRAPARTYIYDWGEPGPGRIRQIQRHILLAAPDRVVTLTGTTLLDLFPQTEELFEAVFDSFTPQEPGTP
jgi:hypothetical protein